MALLAVVLGLLLLGFARKILKLATVMIVLLASALAALVIVLGLRAASGPSDEPDGATPIGEDSAPRSVALRGSLPAERDGEP